ncbi:MAG: hypothetical protein KDB37_05530 [Ilumatobacter sp.]|nr:hypothetical protein [Ilumatobacter sp.]
MSRTVSDGILQVHWLPAVSSAAAPTVAEIAAGTDLTPYLTPDGVNFPLTQNMVDNFGIADTFDGQRIGTWGSSNPNLKMFRDDTDEADTFEGIARGDEGFVLISRFGAPSATARVEVWPAQAGTPLPNPPARNENQSYTQGFAITSAPNLFAVVAA